MKQQSLLIVNDETKWCLFSQSILVYLSSSISCRLFFSFFFLLASSHSLYNPLKYYLLNISGFPLQSYSVDRKNVFLSVIKTESQEEKRAALQTRLLCLPLANRCLSGCLQMKTWTEWSQSLSSPKKRSRLSLTHAGDNSLSIKSVPESAYVLTSSPAGG